MIFKLNTVFVNKLILLQDFWNFLYPKEKNSPQKILNF